MDFQQSQTFINLKTLYEYQLQSSTKYEIFSLDAREERLIEIENIFNTVSGNERVIGERLRNLLLNGDTNTSQNLVEAQDEELKVNNLYREYSSVALEEGYADIAALFNGIANIKLNHSSLFETVSNNLENNEMFCKNEEVLWICLACGNIMNGVCAPDICPVCRYPQGYYQMLRY